MTSKAKSEKSNTEIRLYDELSINDFKPFNQSLKFLDQVVDNVRGKYELADDDYSILLYGRSGAKYKIELIFNQKLARKLHSGYSRLNSKEVENHLPLLLSVFDKVLDYNLYWFDKRTERWDYLCIQQNESEKPNCWQPDIIASLALSLRNDLISAMEPELFTLRESILESLPTYWAFGSNSGFSNVAKYVSILEQIRKFTHARLDDDDRDKLATLVAEGKILVDELGRV